MSEMDKIQKELEEKGFFKTEDMNKVLQANTDLTIRNVLDHKECNDNNCGICTMKKGIDGTAYKRGVLGGIKLGQKYPNTVFEND